MDKLVVGEYWAVEANGRRFCLTVLQHAPMSIQHATADNTAAPERQTADGGVLAAWTG